MAFRFRRSMKIAPGLRVNFTHRGVSARIGPRGLGYTVNASGHQNVSAGIAGSGIHMSKQIKPSRRQKRRDGEAVQSADELAGTSGGETLPTIASLVVLFIVVIVIAGIIT